MEYGKKNAQPIFYANRIQELFLDGHLIANTNYKQMMADVSWQEATKSIYNLNSLALLSFHLNYYLAGVIKVLEGGSLTIRDEFSFKAPPIREGKDWNALANDLMNNAKKMVDLMNQMQENDLQKDFANPKYGNIQYNIQMLIEHSYYHFGQMVLIKKLVQNQEASVN